MHQSTLAEGKPAAADPKRQLTLFDSTCIIVGIIIGSMFYETSRFIALNLPSSLWLVGMWVIGGAISLVGAFCYAELATTYPGSGGDYLYLTRAFDRPIGFLFAWAQLWIVRPGSIGALAYVFANYATRLHPIAPGLRGLMLYAAAAILVLTLINIIGVPQGKWTQNVLTTAKVLGLAAIFVVGMLPASASATPAKAISFEPDFRLALILILLAYGGWNEMAYVAAEVRDPHRNISRSLIIGTLAVTVIYVLATIAFLHTLGFNGVRSSSAIADDVLQRAGGHWAGRFISVLICITALGGINGMIFTGARITYALGSEHKLYAWLGRWDPRRGTPVRSLVIQAVVTLALTIGFGWKANGFKSFVDFMTPVFWVFMLLVALSVFALRARDRDVERPYRVPLYPFIPIIFCLSCGFMVYSSISYAVAHQRAEALWAIVVLAVGMVLCRFDPGRKVSVGEYTHPT